MTAPAAPAPTRDVTAGQVATYAVEAAATAKAAQMAIRAALMRDVLKLWPLLNKTRLSETFPAWLRAMTLVVGNYRSQSSFAAGRFYQQARAEALGSPTPSSLIKLAGDADPEWLAKGLGFSGPGMLSRDTAAPNTALSTTLGTASRMALDGGRTTVAETVKHDRAAVGWYRVTDGDPCAFCALLASRPVFKGRGSLYRSEQTASFQAHNDCGCSAAPMFSRDQPLPAVSHQAAKVYAGLGGGDPMTEFRKAWTAHQSDSAQ